MFWGFLSPSHISFLELLLQKITYHRHNILKIQVGILSNKLFLKSQLIKNKKRALPCIHLLVHQEDHSSIAEHECGLKKVFMIQSVMKISLNNCARKDLGELMPEGQSGFDGLDISSPPEHLVSSVKFR